MWMKRICMFGCAVLVAGGCAGLVRLRTALHRSWELGSRPPAVVFKQVFEIEPPPGIQELHVVGYQALDGWAWMRFRADNVDRVIKALKENARRPMVGPDAEIREDWCIEGQPEYAEYMREVGWSGIKRIHGPEYYHFPKEMARRWQGDVIVDRAHRVFFVYAHLD